MKMDLQPDAPKPRLCHIVKWPDFDGYGFNLHAEKSKTGQYIGKVDQDSPALYAGLHEGDKIIEVNGVNIANENHRQVVERIKSIPNETKLLVLDENGDKWYKEKKITVKSNQSNVIYMKTPVPRPGTINGKEPEVNETITDDKEHLTEQSIVIPPPPPSPSSAKEEQTKDEQQKIVLEEEKLMKTEDENCSTDDNISNKEMVTISKENDNNSLNDKDIEANIINNNNSCNKNNNHIDKVIEKTNNMETKDEDESIASSSPHSIKKMSSNGIIADSNKRPSSIASQESNSKTNSIPGSPISMKSGSITSKDGIASMTSSVSGGDLNLNMSASEMRKLLAQRKKTDPKKVQMDLKQKYEIIQQM